MPGLVAHAARITMAGIARARAATVGAGLVPALVPTARPWKQDGGKPWDKPPCGSGRLDPGVPILIQINP